MGMFIAMILAIAEWIIRSIPTMTATEERSLICLFTIVLPILGCIVWFLHWVNSGDREKEYLARSRPINGTCSHDGVRLREAGVTVHVEWTALTGYGESDGMHFLMWGKEPFPLAPLRFQEIVEARPFWFDLNAGLLHLRKTPTMNFKDREERTIPLTQQFRAFLNTYGIHEPFMLRPEVKRGKSLYRYDFRRPFKIFVKAKGCTWLTPHIMRHTFASLLVSAGESIYKVAVWLGDDVATVQRHYGHLTPDNHGIEKAFSLRLQPAS
jgi:hypothetical protein